MRVCNNNNQVRSCQFENRVQGRDLRGAGERIEGGKGKEKGMKLYVN